MIAEQKIWKQNLKVSLTLFEMKEELKSFIDRAADSFKNDTGALPAFHYYAFNGDDYERGKVTISFFNARQKYFYLTAEEENIEEALLKAKELNKHIRLVGLLLGHNGEDFVYGRITARLEIFQLQQA